MKRYLLPLFFLLLIYSNNINAQFLKVLNYEGRKYLSNQVVIKLKDNISPLQKGKINLPNTLMSKFSNMNLEIINSKKVFENISIKENSSLNNIIIVEYTNNIDPLYLSSKLKSNPEIEWIEPKYIYETEFIPNDPDYSTKQYNLQKINAANAWDISTGSPSIIIGIVDTGIDWDHPDLLANIWTNPNEIVNGIDDDGNGYVDDIRGWDFGGSDGTSDNNPMEDRADHGTHVAGIASAVTNNGIGIASIGYQSKLMPIKTSQDNFRNSNGSPYIVYGYEGIVYAAENGAKVINCSWGGDGYSALGQEVINYATELGALVIAAAGNANSNLNFYPASYDKVLSVASTDQSDKKSGFSNYGEWIDVSAPGSNIYSTWMNNTYTTQNGTSMATPLVCGLAALTNAVFPDYTPLQIAEQIRINCDDIYGSNATYNYQLGKGRINAYKTLSNTNSKSVRAYDIVLSDEEGGNGNGVFESGETISVFLKIRNYLSSIDNFSINLSTTSPSLITIQNGTNQLGALSTLDSTNNCQSPLTFTISQNAGFDQNILFVLNFSDANEQDFQSFKITVNPTYTNQIGNDIALTITSKGTLGFNDYPNNTQGIGFKYLESDNFMFEGALMLGTSSTKISDVARNSKGEAQNTDFKYEIPFYLKVPGNIADVEGYGIFNDANASNNLNVRVKFFTYSFNDVQNKNIIILKYRLSSLNSTQISNLYGGLFLDWDLIEGSGEGDSISYDLQNNFGYVHNANNVEPTYVGFALLSHTNYNFYPIMNDGSDGGFEIYDGFSDSEKWTSLASGISKLSAGNSDISGVISGGPFNINTNDSLDIAFALFAGYNLNELQTAVQNARLIYENIITSFEEENSFSPKDFMLYQNYPNPFNPSTTIKYTIPTSPKSFPKERTFVKLIVYDILGNEITTLVNEEKSAGTYEVEFSAKGLSSGIYFYKLTAGNFISIKKMILLK